MPCFPSSFHSIRHGTEADGPMSMVTGGQTRAKCPLTDGSWQMKGQILEGFSQTTLKIPCLPPGGDIWPTSFIFGAQRTRGHEDMRTAGHKKDLQQR